MAPAEEAANELLSDSQRAILSAVCDTVLEEFLEVKSIQT
jgi:hypothetical protein